MKLLRRFFVLTISATMLLSYTPKVQADAGHDFLMSATYGTLAGTLLGAASLALTDNPGDHLQRIARGASLGLYVGILLGAYIVYGVPDESDELNNILPEEQPAEGYYPILYPQISDAGKIDGIAFDLTVTRF